LQEKLKELENKHEEDHELGVALKEKSEMLEASLSRIKELENSQTELQQEIKQLNFLLDNLKNEVETQSRTLRHHQKLAESQESTSKTQETLISNLQSQLTTKTEEFDSLQHEHEIILEENSKLKKQGGEMKDKILTHQKKESEMNKRLLRKLVSLQQLKSDLEKKEEELKFLQNKRDLQAKKPQDLQSANLRNIIREELSHFESHLMRTLQKDTVFPTAYSGTPEGNPVLEKAMSVPGHIKMEREGEKLLTSHLTNESDEKSLDESGQTTRGVNLSGIDEHIDEGGSPLNIPRKISTVIERETKDALRLIRTLSSDSVEVALQDSQKVLKRQGSFHQHSGKLSELRQQLKKAKTQNEKNSREFLRKKHKLSKEMRAKRKKELENEKMKISLLKDDVKRQKKFVESLQLRDPALTPPSNVSPYASPKPRRTKPRGKGKKSQEKMEKKFSKLRSVTKKRTAKKTRTEKKG